jgi:2-polyprenyl-3-methyl-5-hydroxy-6-metoxy-1,4-benzoquinol methylase
MRDWFADDRFWECLEPFFFSQLRTAEMTTVEVDRIIKLLQPAAGAAILDLCCGPGRHALELVRRGFRVTGVDRTSSYLQAAQSQAARQHVQAEFVQDDMRHFRRSQSFDVALNLFSSFGYFADRNDDLEVL